jgi:energy-coupling factor transporter ATP-binding protein EcfA2
MSDIEEEQLILTPEHEKVLGSFKAGKNLLITGPAGTGKSTLLQQIIGSCEGKSLQCATTGTASLLLPNGQTVHNLFRMGTQYDTYDDLKRKYLSLVAKLKRLVQHNPNNAGDLGWLLEIREARVIIIDECSMLSAWMMGAIDVILGEIHERYDSPWGGMQVIFVGDFAQLPPVHNTKDSSVPKTQGDFAFQSPVWSALKIETHVLTHIFRQEDESFANLLQSIRYKLPLTAAQEAMLAKMQQRSPNTTNTIYINGNKAMVSAHNAKMFQALNKPSVTYPFPLLQVKNEVKSYENVFANVCDTLHMAKDSKHQTFKPQMKVMVVRNVRYGQRKPILVNGDTGIIVCFQQLPEKLHCYLPEGVNPKQLFPVVAIDRYGGIERSPVQDAHQGQVWQCRQGMNTREGSAAIILPAKWEKTRLEFNHQARSYSETCLSSVTALPLIACWAITAHKLQGQTLSQVTLHIDAQNMNWQKGTFYVAISRARQESQVYLENYKGYAQHELAKMFYYGQYQLPPAQVYADLASGEDRLEKYFTPSTNPNLPGSNTQKSSSLAESSTQSTQATQSSTQSTQATQPTRIIEIKSSPNLSIPPTRQSLQEEFKSQVLPVLDAMWQRYQDIKAPKKRHSELITLTEEWCKAKKPKRATQPTQTSQSTALDVSGDIDTENEIPFNHIRRRLNSNYASPYDSDTEQ